ncbi:junctional adhesion molecule A [Toxotes jaculatrix]|uniref:junctional adhesion molecule A n=1 Tax=Toxotes jaculatrix TaxID=941984 RepID=UPI001B3AEEEE|nr:junctional adhesion molecule A [Toxotes jaculatrix]
MTSSSNLQYFRFPRTPRLSIWLLALVWIVTSGLSVTERNPPIHLRGEVGGNVTFHCPVANNEKITLFYFQNHTTFINGYHISKTITRSKWENTRLDRSETSVHMYGLNVSHSGEYQCIIQYSGKTNIEETSIYLSVTANYSKPTITKSHDRGSCYVTCTSHGGYPSTKVTWNVSVPGNVSSQVWKIVNSSNVPSPSTMLFNSSSTAYFNCSNGELTHLSCSVGDVTSDMFSVCSSSKPDGPGWVIVVAASSAVAVFILVALLLFLKHRKKQKGVAPGEPRAERNVNGEELIILYENKGGTEAS